MKEICILLLLFFIYSFLGWTMEVIHSFVTKQKYVNRGFLIGPICPIYGCGGILIFLLLNKYAEDPFILFIMSIIIASIVEYVTSYIMEKIFKNRWWDYSNRKFNINGRICLECSFAFGFVAIIAYYGLNPFLLSILLKIPENILLTVTIILCVITLIDITISFNVILTLKNISNNIRSDSTEAITKKVFEILKEKNYLFRRLIGSFPDMQIHNRMALLKARIEEEKQALKQEKKKIAQKRKSAKISKRK